VSTTPARTKPVQFFAAQAEVARTKTREQLNAEAIQGWNDMLKDFNL